VTKQKLPHFKTVLYINTTICKAKRATI